MQSRTTDRKTRARKAAGVAPSVKIEKLEEPTGEKDESRTSSLDSYVHVPRSKGDTRVSKIQMSGFESIIDSVFTIDTNQVFREVKDFLRFSQNPSSLSYGELVDELNQAQEMAARALQLLAVAKTALATYLGDVEIIKAELHEQCVREMYEKYEDKDDKEVVRKPTIADIDAYKASAYHDEWSDMTRRTSEAKETVALIEGLVRRASERARDLRDMASNSRSI